MINVDRQKYDDSRYLIKRVFKQFIKKETVALLATLFCFIVIAFTTAFNAWLMRPLLDGVFVAKKTKLLIILPLAAIAIAIVRGVASFYQLFITKNVGHRVMIAVQQRLFRHLLSADMQLFHQHSSGRLIANFTNDIGAIRNAITNVVSGVLGEGITLLGLIVMMFYQSWDLALIIFVIIPLSFIPMMTIARKVRDTAQHTYDEIGSFSGKLEETFRNIAIIKSFCRESYEMSRMHKSLERIMVLFRRAVVMEAAVTPLIDVFTGLIVAGVIWYGSLQIVRGEMTAGAFSSFITALLMCYKPLKAILQFNSILQEGLAAARRIFIMLDSKPTIRDIPQLRTFRPQRYSIAMKDVTFSYKSGHKIINKLEITVPEGKTVALVGGSGVGKTTILNLLQRFYEPDSGEILIDNIPIKKIKLNHLRSKIALVSQDVALFDGTVLDNIRYGNLQRSDKQVIEAAKAAAAHHFITQLPNGYQTIIGERGIKLSGGQKQCIAIARALVKDAPILLLDEATSSLDSLAEKQIETALERLKLGRTTIVIAHRLATVENADTIYCIAGGRVVESGSHEELLRKNGAYRKLYRVYRRS